MAGVREFDFSVKGLTELMNALDKVANGISGRQLQGALRYSIKPAEQMARMTIPQGNSNTSHYVERRIKSGKAGYKVSGGFAASQIDLKARTYRDKTGGGVKLGVHTPAFYAVNFVELGTSKQAKQPWLRPAFLQTASEQLSRLKTTLGRIVKAEAKKARKRVL